MRLTVIKGILPDRVIVGFWVGEVMQSVVMSYTELDSLMGQDDIKRLMESPLGIWRANCSITLQV